MEILCYGCMQHIESSAKVCPLCGYNDDTEVEGTYLKTGTVIHDRYVIGKVLGHGGFGITYIAYDTRIRGRVAIKEYMPGDYCIRVNNEPAVTVYNGEKAVRFREGVTEFLQEAKTMAKYNHVLGIAKTIDFVEENGTAYMVMEYLEGETLEDYVKRNSGKITYERMLEIILPVLDALTVVHQDGIIHRDISPDNIYLLNDGKVKLIDFGAAGDISKSLTGNSMILKHGYAPEEQYRANGSEGPFTDVYALCATIYKMLTGVTPVESIERVFGEKRLKGLQEYNTSLNGRQIATVKKGLNVKSDDRYQDIDSLRKALLGASQLEAKWLRIVKRVVAFAAIAIFVVGGAYVGYTNYYLREVPDFSNVLLQDVRLYLDDNELLYSVTYDYDAMARDDVVIEQNIANRDVAPGTEISLTVCDKSKKVVVFEDEYLKKFFADALEKDEILVEDLEKIEHLDLSGLAIQSLMGLQYCSDLVTLDLSDNEIEYFVELEGLEHLEELNLSRNPLKDIGSVSEMKGLLSLDISYTGVRADRLNVRSDSLQKLDISNNNISTLVGNIIAPEMKILNCQHNRLMDIADISNMRNLTHADFHDNLLSDISPVANLTNIFSIDLSDNSIRSMSMMDVLGRYSGDIYINLKNNDAINKEFKAYKNLAERVNVYD